MLWKKESNKPNALYINLCESPTSGGNRIELLYDNLQNEFGIYEIPHVKSDGVATSYRNEGNRDYAKRKWEAAIWNYNKSMCFAENGSETLSLAYANRSSCFLKMKMFRKCLADIELAKQNNYPSDKLDKLEDRKRQCLETMETEEDRSDLTETKLDFDANENFPCLANVVKLEYNNEHGRHMVATENIEVGKQVVVEQCYFGAMTCDRYRNCCICFKQTTNLMPCKYKCTTSMFCSDCVDNNNGVHDIECEIIKYYEGKYSHVIDNRSLLVRSILLAMNAYPNIDQLIAVVENSVKNPSNDLPSKLTDPQSKYRTFLTSAGKVTDQTNVLLIYLVYKIMMGHPRVSTFFKTKSHRRFFMHLLGHQMNVIGETCNFEGYPIQPNKIVAMAHRVNFICGIAKHSCAPNAVLTRKSGSAVLTVIRPIEKREQIFVSRMKCTFDTKIERQQKLMDRGDPECTCERCQLDDDLSNNQMMLDRNFMYIQSVYDKKKLAYDRYDCKQIETMKSICRDLLMKYGRSLWCNELAFIIEVYSVLIRGDMEFGCIL